MKAEDYDPVNLFTAPFKWSVLLFGKWGSWKTTTACSLVSDKGLLISADNSWKVLTKPEHQEIANKITPIQYEGLSQLDNLDYSGYDTVILDPVSEMTDRYVDLLVTHAKWKGSQREVLQGDKTFNNIEIAAPSDYRVTRNQFLPILTKLYSLPVNLVFTAHLNNPMKMNPDTDMTKRAALPFGVYSILARNVDALGYMTARKNKSAEVCVDEGAYLVDAKSRITGLKGTVPVEDFVRLVKNWKQQ